MRRRATYTLPDRFGRCREIEPPARRTLAEDARALLVDLYGTEGPRRCRYTADMFPEAPRRPVEHEPAPPEVQRDLFAPP